MKEIFEKLIREIPDYKVFLTVDELDESSRKLAEEYPDVVSVFEFGRTREDMPLLCMKIGNGSQNALMFGCPHPNEPIGTMMLEFFTRKLAESKELRDELDYTWYIVKAWDADSLRLNEKWLKGPYTIYNYSRNFFRPAGFKQVDWTFPIDYKNLHFHEPIPETVAMMKLIDMVQPSFIYSLHNAGFGGVYWYVSEDCPNLYKECRALTEAQEIPLNLGEPEAPYCQTYAPAVYKDLDITDEYNYLETYGMEHPESVINVGNCSASYAKQYNSFTLLTEMPYFYDKRITDMSDADMTRKEAVKLHLAQSRKDNEYILNTLAISSQYFDPENPFFLALKAFSTNDSDDATLKMIEGNPEFERTATVAEKFDNVLIPRFYKMLSYGMLVRANESELEKMEKKGEVNPAKKEALQKAFEIAAAEHKKLADFLESEIDYEVVPIKKLVTIQLSCGLLYAQEIHERKAKK